MFPKFFLWSYLESGRGFALAIGGKGILSKAANGFWLF
jgi:hypothetical protein